MRTDLKPGNLFPDFTLPDHNGHPVTLSKFIGGFPTILVFSRGYF